MKKLIKKIYNSYQNFTLYAYILYYIKLSEMSEKTSDLIYKQDAKIRDRH